MLSKSLPEALDVLKHGGVIVYPTEAVYGIGCCADNLFAVEKILSIKQRSVKKGLILLGSQISHFEPYLEPLTPAMTQKLDNSWPGPVTWVLPALDSVSELLRGQYDTIAVRISDHPVCKALCEGVGGALVSTSANLAGETTPNDISGVQKMLGKRVDLYLDLPLGGRLSPSEIRDGRTGETLRPSEQASG